jgi:glucosyl-3-phosphoglycerate synthase
MIPSEMDRPALARILDELTKVPYVDTLLISLNRATAEDHRAGPGLLRPLLGAQGHPLERGPRRAGVPGAHRLGGLYVGEPGKGRACWLAMGYILAEERVEYLAFHDADVVNYSREMLARLVLPAIDRPSTSTSSRVTTRACPTGLHGRVTRLLLAPLLAAFTRLIGSDPYIRYLSSFRYALSGEFADEGRPGGAHAPALRLGARDRHAVRGAAPSGAGARLPGGAGREL